MTIRSAAVVAPSPVPMRLGGAERHWEMLRRSLEDQGVATDLIKLPVREHTLADLLDGYEDFGLLDLSHVDLVVSGKYPAWMVSHPNHVVWMLHPLRGLHDTYNPAAHETEVLPDSVEAEHLAELLADPPVGLDPFEVIDATRAVLAQLGTPASPDAAGLIPSRLSAAVVRLLDRLALGTGRVRRHLAISEAVASRPTYFPPGISPEILIPPSCLPDPAPTDPQSGFLSVGRLDGPKRVDLAIDAFVRLGDPAATLTICGDGPEREALERRSGGHPGIRFLGRVSDAELAEQYGACGAVLVTPLEEDFGYVAIEAMQAGRPVITTTDSGGPALLATDGVDGLVVDPTPSAISGAMAELLDRPEHERRLGERARATAAAHSWPRAAATLLESPPAGSAGSDHRGRVVAVSTYPVAQWRGGGPERARHLLGALAEDGWQVEVVAMAPEGTAGSHVVAAEPGEADFSEVTLEVSERHADAEKRLRRLTANISVTDIVASVLWPASPQLAVSIGQALRGADLAVAVQPYLASAVRALAPEVPLVLDAHNHERTLKAQMLPDDEAGHWMLDRVADVEGLATRSACLVVATTAEDARGLETDHGLAPGTVEVVPNGVSTDAVAYTAPPERSARAPELRRRLGLRADAPVALFVGSAHRPNVDAAAEILDVARTLPEVSFVLAGEHSDQVDAASTPANVHLLGAVDAELLEALFAGSDVALNPMRTGGGSNLKVLGYFAAGIPVVSTPMGVRGIPDPSRYAVVTNIDRFGEAVADLLSGLDADSTAAGSDARVANARELVTREFDWAIVAKRFAGLVSDRSKR